MQKGYDLYPSEHNFKYFTSTRLQSAVAIKANCKQTTQFSHFVILNIARYSLYDYRLI